MRSTSGKGDAMDRRKLPIRRIFFTYGFDGGKHFYQAGISPYLELIVNGPDTLALPLSP